MIDLKSIGPVYWGHEYPPHASSPDVQSLFSSSYGYELPDQRRLTYSWVVEDREPYRRSIWGFRVKINRTHGLHIGVLGRKHEPPHRNLKFDPSDISSWGRDDVQEEERAASDS